MDKEHHGWYDYPLALYAWDQNETAKETYTNMLKERIEYFKNNPNELIKFYMNKITSMWTENTYESLWNNETFNSGNEITDDELRKDEIQINSQNIFTLFQKAVIVNIFLFATIILIQNRKNLENEVILLVLVFIGGFLFHVIWEAKSRYVIPYIIVLIPILSIELKEINIKNILFKRNTLKEENK